MNCEIIWNFIEKLLCFNYWLRKIESFITFPFIYAASSHREINLMEFLRRFVQNPRLEEGQGLVEYALILVLVAVVVIVILAAVGKSIRPVLGQVECTLQYRDKYTWVTPADALSVGAHNYGCNLRWPTLDISVIDATGLYPAHLEFDIATNEIVN